MTSKRTAAIVCGATLGLVMSAIGPATTARADDIRSYQVDFTNGWGVRLRQAPEINAPGFGADGKMAIPEGATFAAECEDYGDSVTNDQGQTTDVWLRAPGGVWVSTAYLETGTNGRVGLPLCVEKDAALQASVEPTTVADYHRDGVPAVMVVNDDQTSSRVYFSQAETRRVAEEFTTASGRADAVNTVGCVAVGVLAAVAFRNPSLVKEIAAGVSVDAGCDAFTSSLQPDGFDKARGAASAAADAGKCYEVRSHKDESTGEWTADVWTVTDHQDWCA